MPASKPIYFNPELPVVFPATDGQIRITPDGYRYTRDAVVSGTLNYYRDTGPTPSSDTYSVTVKPGVNYEFEFAGPGNLEMKIFDTATGGVYYDYKYQTGDTSQASGSGYLTFTKETTLSLSVSTTNDFTPTFYNVLIYAEPNPFHRPPSSTGRDSYVILEPIKDCLVTWEGSERVIYTPALNYYVNGIERIIFSDKRLAFDFEDSAGDAFRLYKAAFDRSPDQVGLGFWISKLDGGMSTVEVAANFINSDEFRGLYGANPTTTEFVTELYDNILNRAPDQAGLDFYVQQIDSGAKGRDVVLADFADSQENHVQLLGQMQNGIEYITWLG